MDQTTEINSVFWIGTSVMFLFAFGIIFLVLFYQNYFLKMKRNEADLLLKASLESENKERIRIAADLHDGVSGDLNAIKNYIVILERINTLDVNQEIFKEIRESISAALENTRLISYKLMPPLLETVGLVATIEDYFEQLSRKTHISFTVSCKEETFILPAYASYELYRVIQEFTTNMIKYGAVRNCLVVFYRLEGTIYIEIVDDGQSYDFVSLLHKSKGTGIKNINSRLKVIEAVLQQREVVEGNHFVISLKKQL